jgi:pimeloyl-ACP methyl ester carboxylesterase
MSTRNRCLLAFLLLTTGMLALLRTGYSTWKRKLIGGLRAGSRVVETPAGTVEYWMEGTGPALLIAHGSPGGYDQGALVARLLSDGDYICIAPSRPGYLRTPLASGQTPEAQADLYTALLETLGIEHVTMVGVSGGGPSAIQFAVRHPGRCQGLVLMCAVTRHYSDQEVLPRLPLPMRITRKIFDWMILFDPTLFWLVLQTQWLPGMKPMRDFLNSFAPHALRKVGYENDMHQFDRIKSYPLENVSVPTLILHARQDPKVLFLDAELAASRIPQAHLVPFEGPDHTFFITRKDTCTSTIRKFLATV